MCPLNLSHRLPPSYAYFSSTLPGCREKRQAVKYDACWTRSRTCAIHAIPIGPPAPIAQPDEQARRERVRQANGVGRLPPVRIVCFGCPARLGSRLLAKPETTLATENAVDAPRYEAWDAAAKVGKPEDSPPKVLIARAPQQFAGLVLNNSERALFVA